MRETIVSLSRIFKNRMRTGASAGVGNSAALTGSGVSENMAQAIIFDYSVWGDMVWITTAAEADTGASTASASEFPFIVFGDFYWDRDYVFGGDAAAAAATPYYTSAWTYRKKITVPAGTYGEDMADRDLYINGAGLPDAFFAATTATGSDIIVTALNGTTLLPFELVHYDQAAKTMELHTKVQAWHDEDLSVILQCGNPAAVTSLQDPDAVWDSGYVGVWHMGAAGNLLDSTANALTATDAISQTDLTGKLYATGGQKFDANDYAYRADETIIDLVNAYSYEAWVNFTAPLATGVTMHKDSAYGFKVWNTGQVGVYILQGALQKTTQSAAAGTLLTAGAWHHLVITWARTHYATPRIYLNGTSLTIATAYPVDADIDNTAAALWIGHNGAAIIGNMDEVRLSNVERSANWYAATYANHNDTSTFYVIGDV